ncbi:MAG: ABC transporter ATP-binding protein [Chloroflexi bacterium]|nr:ABC transporter ATP-binding protein [Chloroflexota bacterium]
MNLAYPSWLREPVVLLGNTTARITYITSLVCKEAPFAGSLLVVQSLASGATTPFIVWAISGLIDALPRSSSDQSDVWPAVVPWLLVLLVAFVIRSLDGALGDYLSQLTGLRLGAAVQHMVCEKAISLPLSTFEREEYYTKLQVAGKEAGSALSDLLENLSWLLTSLVGATGLMVIFFSAHWLAGVALVAVMALRSIVQSVIERHMVEVTYRNSPRWREMSYWSRLLTSREAVPELRLSGLADYLLRRRRGVFQRFLGEVMAAQRKMALPGLASVAAQEGVALIVVLVLLVALSGNITLGSVVALLYGLSRFRTLADNVSAALGNVYSDLQYAEYLQDFLAIESEPPATQGEEQELQRPLRQAMQFHRVSFTYPGAVRPALTDLELSLRPGERIALVGENGAGKTTLVRLLLGLYQPTQGTITVDGADLTTIHPATWRREATAIFQDFVRYPTTVFENIAYGDSSLLAQGDQASDVIHPRITAAAAKSGLHGFVSELPSGYWTYLGKEWPGGMELSAGQWQRLALARAYLRDAQIVALDEPTAALDPRAEVEFYRQFVEVAAGRTAVLVSHRLGAARLADRIVVLASGRIVEEGDHTALLSLGGVYAQMFRLQAHWYNAAANTERG